MPQVVFKYFKQGITGVYPSVAAERINAFAVKVQGQLLYPFSEADLMDVIKESKGYSCKRPVTWSHVSRQISIFAVPLSTICLAAVFSCEALLTAFFCCKIIPSPTMWLRYYLRNCLYKAETLCKWHLFVDANCILYTYRTRWLLIWKYISKKQKIFQVEYSICGKLCHNWDHAFVYVRVFKIPLFPSAKVWNALFFFEKVKLFSIMYVNCMWN